jgi:hypothetical protein
MAPHLAPATLSGPATSLLLGAFRPANPKAGFVREVDPIP